MEPFLTSPAPPLRLRHRHEIQCTTRMDHGRRLLSSPPLPKKTRRPQRHLRCRHLNPLDQSHRNSLCRLHLLLRNCKLSCYGLQHLPPIKNCRQHHRMEAKHPHLPPHTHHLLHYRISFCPTPHRPLFWAHQPNCPHRKSSRHPPHLLHCSLWMARSTFTLCRHHIQLRRPRLHRPTPTHRDPSFKPSHHPIHTCPPLHSLHPNLVCQLGRLFNLRQNHSSTPPRPFRCPPRHPPNLKKDRPFAYPFDRLRSL